MYSHHPANDIRVLIVRQYAMKPRWEVVRALFVFDELPTLFEVTRVIMVRVIDEAQRLCDSATAEVG